jgi:hypothetical protein
MHRNNFLIYCPSCLSSDHSRFIHQSSLLWLQQRHLISKRGETWRKIVTEFCLSVSLSYLKGSLAFRKILRHEADDFASPPKEVVLQIFIVLKSPSLLAGFEPGNFGSSGKHYNHYTGSDNLCLKISPCYFRSSANKPKILVQEKLTWPQGRKEGRNK